MIGRRATVGLSLLCALMVCAFAAQSASAAKGLNTTAFTCVKGGTEQFEDAHCDKTGPNQEGPYGHVAIEKDVTTDVTADNSTTGGATEPAILKGKAFGAALQITCTKVHGEGKLHNVESEKDGKKVHTVTGSLTTNFSSCSVQKPSKCTVKEPIVVEAVGEGVEELGAEKNEMGVEFKPASGTTFVEITLEGSECALKGKPFKVQGTAIATGGTATQKEKWGGATAVFTNAMTKETLEIGGVAAEFETKTTVRMAPEGGKEQNPISLTTFTTS